MKTAKQIHIILQSKGLSAEESVRRISEVMHRAESTVWGWVSNREPGDNTLKLLNILIEKDL